MAVAVTAVFAALGGVAVADTPVGGGDIGVHVETGDVGVDPGSIDPGTADGEYSTPADSDQTPMLAASLAEGETLIEVATGIEADLVFTMDAVDVERELEARVVTTTTELDAGGSLVSSQTTTALADLRAAQTGQYACVLDGDELKKRSIVAHPPSTLTFYDQGMDLQYQIHPYQSNMARQVFGGVGWTWQVELCVVGGAETFEKWRLLYVASGTTAIESYESRIGAAWESGTDLPKIEASLGMNVAPDGSPVTVNASASQKATGVNSGSKATRMPQKSSMDTWKHNAALARWDHVCPSWQQGFVSRKYCGSEDYQATITQVLFEWPRSPEHGEKSIRTGWWSNRRCGELAINCKK